MDDIFKKQNKLYTLLKKKKKPYQKLPTCSTLLYQVYPKVAVFRNT